MEDVDHPLRKWRGDKPQAEAAEALEVDVMTISRWERGLFLPHRRHWPKIKEQTGLTIADFAEHLRPSEAAQ